MKALIAMSGGVDSSVAAALAIKKGYDCIGVTMRLFDRDGCSEININNGGTGTEGSIGIVGNIDDADKDIKDAALAAARLGIPHMVYDLRQDFKEKIMAGFAECYLRGETPNPCTTCNRYIKFGGLLEKARELGCDRIITGHYARVEANKDTGRFELKKGRDESKDQSYVLYSLTQEQLAMIELPLGEYTKEECRRMAAELGLDNADKKDSQDICFIPDGNYRRFIESFTGKIMPQGNFVDVEGNVLGRHNGICSYTIGQRKGLGVALGKPAFVKEIRPDTNEVVLSGNDELFNNTLHADDFNWISVTEDEVKAAGQNGIRCEAKIRYRHKAAPAAVSIISDVNAGAWHTSNGSEYPCRTGSSGPRARIVKVVFDEPQRAITKGQAVVLYDGDKVIGGGTICG